MRRSLLGRVRDLTHDGLGVVATDEGLIFVAGVLPGEEIELEPQRGRRARRGRLRSILKPSADRVEPACDVVQRCGGCPLMSWRLEAQRAHKRQRVSEAAGVEATLLTAGPPLGYRRRARLAFDDDRIGYRPHRSRGIVAPDRCVVLREPLGAALSELRRRVRLTGRGEVALALGAGGRAVVSIDAAEPQGPAVYEALRRWSDEGEIAGASLRVAGAGPATFGDPRPVLESEPGSALVAGAGGFTQANDEVAKALRRRVVELAQVDGAEVAELYAGAGFLTVELARRAASVLAIEEDSAAADACRQNLRDCPGSVKIRTGDAAALSGRFDVVVLDPPRTGAREAVAPILAAKPSRIVYVSCDPATLGRDRRALEAGGYASDAATAFDMFPHTAHVEAVVRLRRSA